MNKFFILFLAVALMTTNANADADWAMSAGFSDADIQGVDNGIQTSLVALNSFGPFGLGGSMYVWTGDGLVANGMSIVGTMGIVDIDQFQFHVYVSSPVVYHGVQGEGRDVGNGLENVDNADRSFGGFVEQYGGAIIMFSPNEGVNTMGLKIGMGDEITSAEFMFSF